MRPFSERTADRQYRDLLLEIAMDGRVVRPIQGTLDGSGQFSKMVTGRTLRYDLENGFPLITERDLSGLFKGALSEHFAFLHGARTLDEMADWGCRWWKRWVTAKKCAIFGLPEGDLGDGSYGMAWSAFPTAGGGTINQIRAVLDQVKWAAREGRFIRTHRIANWIPGALVPEGGKTRRTVVAPCHGDIQILTFPDSREVEIHHHQRSADVPVGLVFNIVQYMAFGMMVAQIIDYKMRSLVHHIVDAHIYEEQLPQVEELLDRNPRPFPTVTLASPPGDIFDFRPENFTLGDDYNPHPAMRIPTPI